MMALLLPQVVALHQFVQPGGPIPRGCVTDERTFVKGLPAEVSQAAWCDQATAALLLLLLMPYFYATDSRLCSLQQYCTEGGGVASNGTLPSCGNPNMQTMWQQHVPCIALHQCVLSHAVQH